MGKFTSGMKYRAIGLMSFFCALDKANFKLLVENLYEMALSSFNPTL